MESQIPVVLTIAGSDPSGGAGIQADLKTFSALCTYGASVITALTAQNTCGVRAIHDVPVGFIKEQLDAIFEDLPVAAVKIGMLSRTEVVLAVAEALRAQGTSKVILDPVMVAKSGAALLSEDAVGALRSSLVPLAEILTPNYPEAAVLLGTTEADVARDPEQACRALLALGTRAVVLKGGHSGEQTSTDYFYDGEVLMRLPAPRVATRSTHGTGCTFAAAMAALRARGAGLVSAVTDAKRYISGAIAAADRLAIGKGHGPVHHFFRVF